MPFAVWLDRVRYAVLKPRAPFPKREAVLLSGGKLLIFSSTSLINQGRQSEVWRSD